MNNWQSFDSCVACGTMSVDRCYHHVYTRKAHPEFVNESWNLMSLCAAHHSMVHAKGMPYMADKFPNIKAWLENNNWYTCECTGKITHD